MIMGHILKIQPVFKEMIWGGHKLRDVYGYDIPSDSTVQVVVVMVSMMDHFNIN